MIVSIPKESEAERRVALIPKDAQALVQGGFEVWIETEAGARAFFGDALYTDVGAKVIDDSLKLWNEADLFLKVAPPTELEVEQLKEGATLIGFLNPFDNAHLLQQLAAKKAIAFALELIPRISRAQSMDALSSQASIAGYKAVITAAWELGKLFPMMTTAAGTIRPAKVLILGAGVAGLQAIATARRLGAQVEAVDIRPEVKEQVESLGARFVEGSDTAKHVADSDVVITTALVPGKKAPLLITDAMLQQMRLGSVVVDLAAEQGGNVEGSQLGNVVHKYGVEIMGPRNVPSSVPMHASQMYSKNISTLLTHITKEGTLNLDFNDEIIAATCVTHAGEVRYGK